jgi:hypothetical protein
MSIKNDICHFFINFVIFNSQSLKLPQANMQGSQHMLLFNLGDLSACVKSNEKVIKITWIPLGAD